MGYTSERNTQIVIALLKHHGIKRIVASPGATNVSFVASVQQDDFFEIYSSVDERSAAYIACGLAEESGEPVVLSCTGATASRNYFPGLTEAFYRKLPILAITSTMPIGRIGHNDPQMLDRTVVTNDVAKLSVYIPMVKDQEDEWVCATRANQAILELNHHVCGPVHMNLETVQGGNFEVKELPSVQLIDRITLEKPFPQLDGKKVAIFVGAHSIWSKELTESVDDFCRNYNAVVLSDHTGNYKGEYCISASLITNQTYKDKSLSNYDVIIHLGNISGAYLSIGASEVWRVSSDGMVCDSLRKLRYIFEMDETCFFEEMNRKSISNSPNTMQYQLLADAYNRIHDRIPELPFSNIWIAKEISCKLPEKSILHLGILNSLRSWNFFDIPRSVFSYSNTGGFGIDGCISTALGASLFAKDKLVFLVVGDLAFFYDMNVLGNRHFGNNLRLLVVNNGRGQEFKNFGHRASQFGQLTDEYIAAAGHYGNQSETLVKGVATSLGFKYLTARNKEDFLENEREFLQDGLGSESIVFEVFTDSEDETAALKKIVEIEAAPSGNGAKQFARKVLGEKGFQAVRSVLKG